MCNKWICGESHSRIWRNLKKVILYGWPIIKVKYFNRVTLKSLKKKKYLLISMVLKYNVSKSTIVFKVALSKQIDNHPKMKNLSLSIHYFKKHLQTIREVCKENAREFKKTIKICLKTLAFLLHWFCFIWNFNHAIFSFLINKKSHVAFLSSTCGSILSNICGSIFE